MLKCPKTQLFDGITDTILRCTLPWLQEGLVDGYKVHVTKGNIDRGKIVIICSTRNSKGSLNAVLSPIYFYREHSLPQTIKAQKHPSRLIVCILPSLIVGGLIDRG